MSSTGDELSPVESRGGSIVDGDTPASFPPPSAQVPAQPSGSSPQAQTGATNDDIPNEEGETSEDSDRENRFQGPDSTWRKYTQEERQLAASLDQQRANDPSIHLYNTHALKARLYNPEAASRAKSWQSKQQWIKPNEDGRLPWHPDRGWTAWPLTADEVPRREEQFGGPAPDLLDNQGTYRKSEPWLPSADLQEEIQALMLRKAKERFRRRRWATADDDAGAERVPTEKVEETPEEEAAAEGSSGPEAVDLGEDDKSKPTLPKSKYARPAFLADDDQASAILQPTVRHILSKFDDLLIGLHKSRQGHRRQASASRSRSRPSASRLRSRSAAVAKAPCSRDRSKGKQKADDSDDEVSEYGSNDEDANSAEESIPSRPAEKKRSISRPSKHELGLRDWSEVLGIASLVGWDQAVVDRAARRCAALFGEGMAFRRMPETAAERVREQTVRYIPEMVPPLESETESDETTLDESNSTVPEPKYVRAWFCPYEDCSRHDEAYDKGWRWREHLRRTHKLSKERVHAMEMELGFGRQKDVSGHAEPSASDPDEHTTEVDGTLSGPDGGEEMAGGVHVDGFLRPVTEWLERGRDKKTRRRRSTNRRKGSKRRRIDPDEETDSQA